METYVIGDVHGCLHTLQALIQYIPYRPHRDQIWFAGDLTSRGPYPVETLRAITQIPRVQAVLGNHDLAVLARPAALHPNAPAPPDLPELLTWLQERPFMHCAEGHILVHAGIYPRWDLETAMARAQHLSDTLQREAAEHGIESALRSLAGDPPQARFDAPTPSATRTQFDIRVFTRMRFLGPELDRLELNTSTRAAVPGLVPWFRIRNPRIPYPVCFGHWSALEGHTGTRQAIALDTGCVFGGMLSAVRLSDRQIWRVPYQEDAPPSLG